MYVDAGADPGLHLEGPNVMGVWDEAPTGIQGRSPGQGVRRTKPPEADIFSLAFTEMFRPFTVWHYFLIKLSHKFRKFRLHGERGSASEPA